MSMLSMLCGSAMQAWQGAAGIRKARQQSGSDARAALVDKKQPAHRQPLHMLQPAFEAARPHRQLAARHAVGTAERQRGDHVYRVGRARAAPERHLH